MRSGGSRRIGCGIVAAMLSGGIAMQAQTAKAAPYPTMAPLAQYMIDHGAEIALARSAAPKSISGNAEVLVLGRAGFQVCCERHEWMGLLCAAVVECGGRFSGILEFEDPCAHLPQSHRSAHGAARGEVLDRDGARGKVKGVDGRRSESRVRHEEASVAGAGRDELYDVEGRIPGR